MNKYDDYFKRRFNLSLLQVIDKLKLNYDEDIIQVLLMTDEREITENRGLYSKLLTLTHNRDNRSILQFAQEIIGSWICEDFIKRILEKFNNVKLIHNGSDANRTFQYANRVSSNSDFIIEFPNGVKRNLELQISLTDYYDRVPEVFIRDNKLQKMINNEALFLVVDLHSEYMYLWDFNTNNYMYRESPASEHPWLNKDGYQLYLGDRTKYKLTKNIFCAK